MPPVPSPGGDYVDCCICTYDRPLTIATYDTLKYLPIKTTLYLTWGRWAGYLYWDTEPDPTVPSSIWHNAWSGIVSVHFDNWPIRDGYGNCTTTSGDYPVLMVLNCNSGLGGYIYNELVTPPTTPYWLGVLTGFYSPGPPYLKYDCDGGFTIEGNGAIGLTGPCGPWFYPPDDMIGTTTINLTEA